MHLIFINLFKLLGEPIQQKGLENAQSALDWIVNQVNTKQLASTFTDLIIIGNNIILL